MNRILILPLSLGWALSATASSKTIMRPFVCEYEKVGESWRSAAGVLPGEPIWMNPHSGDKQYLTGVGSGPWSCINYRFKPRESTVQVLFDVYSGSNSVFTQTSLDCSTWGLNGSAEKVSWTLEPGEWHTFLAPPGDSVITRFVVYFPLEGENFNQNGGSVFDQICEKIRTHLRSPSMPNTMEHGNFKQ